ncbi:bacterial transcriptional activator domain-containing protein [Streptomyces malaysiensis]|uniref:bacterial transcriptional activator domain-containing protein n=1 Tax=Streptomyces malaysiensis TaxID=92644 RepID=UPI0036F2221E
MRQYQQCRRVLLDELGLEPSPTLSNLVPPHPGHSGGATPEPPARRIVCRPAGDAPAQGTDTSAPAGTVPA